ncbi:VOC family protein [Aeromicrobium duanguangcaii]|uniref:VOC family protein n=1 Tax=Aeromicrobium duanguangcaii TaxID=2968086 RepID=A0ABY5KD82_9ACTN|nr:VOC family protein [Aeromicrobium duanguangcaii]MCD9155097.1 VOC family protein [Aeromicrobium duanguangcaii]UUI68249.1 VOC family protein [Aeromicrobium duanguangcaii]
MSLDVQITFDAHDAPALADFWAAALDYVVPGPPGVALEPGADPWLAWDVFLERVGVPVEQRRSKAAIEDPQGRGPRVFFQQVPEEKMAKNRVHLDVRSAAPDLAGDARMEALEAAAERLVARGATRRERFEPDPPLETGFLVMQDPEGNEFCLT